MAIEIHVVDAFADGPFTGNPAAVCFAPVDASEAWLRAVAAELNLSETAFLWPENGGWRLRWLTPQVEVDLCGHATLASAHVLWESGRLDRAAVARFSTRSGELCARLLDDGAIALDFPATMPEPAAEPPGLLAALGASDRARVLRSRFDYLVVVGSEADVRLLQPDFRALRELDVRGVIVTAAGESGFDFVSRFFAPGSGVDEDPVTGSAHCALGPYWSARLGGKGPLTGHQASARGGTVVVDVRGERVELRGRAVTVLRGELLC